MAKKIKSSNKLNESSTGTGVVQTDAAKRNQMIATAAYFRAEKRGFSPNNDLADWFESEREIDRRLGSSSAF